MSIGLLMVLSALLALLPFLALISSPEGAKWASWMASSVCHIDARHADGEAGKDSLEIFGARHGKHMQYTAAKVYFLSSIIAVLLLASIFLRGAYLILDGGMQVTKSLWTLRPMSNIFQPKRQPAFDPVVDFQSF